jgi:hypothetical protein
MTLICKKESTDFLGVALAARQRGFTWIVPVDDKSPLRNKWLKFNVTPTVTELNLMAAEFPNRDVGIVLKGHAGSVFVWDIDNIGVLERMESETGRKLPLTYTVQSRPDSAPHKMHVYFRQTEHFAALFPKQVYAGDYDLKGMGGGQVVAEGCLRQDTGEVRIGNGKPVITIPDWLTDWLKKDSGPLVAAMNAKKREAAKALVKSPNGIVTTGQRTLYLRNKASIFFENGLSRKFILDAITELCRTNCENGKTWAASTAGKKKLRAIANDTMFRQKRINPVYTRTQGLKIFRSTTMDAQRKERFQTLVSAVAQLPSPVTAAEAYRLLGLDTHVRADQLRLARAMRAGGFSFGKGRVWRKDQCVVPVSSDDLGHPRHQTVLSPPASLPE